MSLASRINAVIQNIQNGKNAIAEAITAKGTPASGSETFESLALKIRLTDKGGVSDIPITQNHMVVEITGACEIDVSSLGEYGVMYRISDTVASSNPIAAYWAPASANTLACWRKDNTITTSTYASYWSYNATTHKFKYNGSTSASYNMRGTWLLIGINN